MSVDKRRADLKDAVGQVSDGSTVLIGGFGDAGFPFGLLEGLEATQATELTLVANNAGQSSAAVLRMIQDHRIRKVICTYPRRDEPVLARAVAEQTIELEVVPQGTLAERIRAAGAGIPAFFLATAAGTALGDGKETRDFDGRQHILETALNADLALIKAHRADPWGNLTYHGAARNYNPVMATAAAVAVAEVDEVVELGSLDPETVVTPGIFIDRLIELDSSELRPPLRSPRAAA